MSRLLLSTLILAAFGFSADHAVKPGVERWQVKTSGPDASAKATKVAIADLLAFPNIDGIAKDDSRYQAHRIPDQTNGKHKEGELITTTGWLFLVAGETDGDYHIQISNSSESGDHCLVVEVPNPDPQYVPSADLRPQFEAVRAFIKSKLLADKDPSVGGSVMQHPPYVTVTGVLFYDDSHVGDQPRGKKGMKAATLWELHPVTSIAFAPKPN
jgi:hypothetical protein